MLTGSLLSIKSPKLALTITPKSAQNNEPLVPQGVGVYGHGFPYGCNYASEVAEFYWQAYGLIVIPAIRGQKMPCDSWADIDDRHKAADIWEMKVGQGTTSFNYACLTGPSGVTVIDYDTVPDESYDINYPKTFTVKTPRGLHRYYKVTDKEIGNSVNQERKIDVRGVGGIAILPGSMGSGGLAYSLLDSSPIKEITYDEFLKIVPWYQDEVRVVNEPGWFGETIDWGAEKGSRNDTIAKVVGYLVNKGLTFDDVRSIIELWNNIKIEPPLKQGEFVTIIRSVFNTHERNNPIVSQTDANEFNDKFNQASTDPSNPFA